MWGCDIALHERARRVTADRLSPVIAADRAGIVEESKVILEFERQRPRHVTALHAGDAPPM